MQWGLVALSVLNDWLDNKSHSLRRPISLSCASVIASRIWDHRSIEVSVKIYLYHIHSTHTPAHTPILLVFNMNKIQAEAEKYLI